jgi:1,4-dihydroxy-2-naphthoate octaprenyltransferase
VKFGNDDGRGAKPLHDAPLIRLMKRVFWAPRPIFFPASVCPVILGTAWGFRLAGELDTGAFTLAVAATVFVHAAANVINDVYDDISGTDAINAGRIHPFTGGSRFIQDGLMGRTAMRRLGLVLLIVAGLFGLALSILKGPEVIIFGLFGMGLGIAYSATPLQLSARGFGELAVGIGFGVLPVTGSAWLQSGTFDLGALLISLPTSFWVLNILLINEMPDSEADAMVGKRTLPVRLGSHGTLSLYLANNTFALLAITTAVALGLLPGLAITLPSILLTIGLYITLTVMRSPAVRSTLTFAIKATLFIHLVGVLWLTVFVWP